MEANYNYSERVYVTNYGKKYHFDANCSYIKGKEIISISLKEAKSDLEGACSRCFNKRNNKVAINRNFNKISSLLRHNYLYFINSILR